MSLTAGDKLGPYEIISLIGKGGMGEVYSAHDPRTGRDVAIKVSAERFNERFDREVRAVAALNHPNICHLYDVGPNYLVMELVEGEAPKGPLPLDEALRIARQITDALEAAHDKGITHRDLKPGNIKVKPDGTVKVLDFGLAKIEATSAVSQSEHSPTLSMAATQMGMILGTAAYMAPEQAKGKPVDKRADIWAFGVVLYELLTGERLFQHDDATETLAAVVMKVPEVERAPFEVRRLLKKCLEKDPKKRLRDIGDVWELLEADSARRVSELQADGPRHSTWVPWAAAGVCLAAALALGFVAFRPTEAPRVFKSSVLLPPGAVFDPTYSLPAFSPDGRRLAVSLIVNGKTELWVRELDSLSVRPLPGTDGAQFPFWAPDSRWIGFFTGGKLRKIDVTGGAASTVCEASANPRGGTWNQNDVIVFAPANIGGLSQCPAAGGTASTLTKPDGDGLNGDKYPWFLPDDHHFLYTAVSADPNKTVIYVADLDAKDNAKTRIRLLAANSNAAYVAPGYLLFVRERTLMSQPFDASKLQITGAAVQVAEDVDYLTSFSQGRFAVSQNGVLAYTSGSGEGKEQLTWLDRFGKTMGTLGKPGEMHWPAISPDGKSVAVDRRDPQTDRFDIWLYDLTRSGSESQFTFGPGNNQWPVWSGDSSRIAFNSARGARNEIYQRAISGAAADEALAKADGNIRADDWSRDGRYIIEERPSDPKTLNDIWVLPVLDKKEAYSYVASVAREQNAKLSPNGRWLAYQSDASKRSEIYVETFPVRGGVWKVSTEGGTRPAWSQDSTELYFISADQKMMGVEIRAGATFASDPPKALFDVHALPNARFDVKDGRFLVLVSTQQAGSVPLTVVNNWPAALKK